MFDGLSGCLRTWCKADPYRNLGVILAVVLVVLAAAVFVNDYHTSVTPLEKQLKRNDSGKGSRTEELEVETENGERTELEVEVKERIYTSDELRRMFDRSTKKLEQIILGTNKSLDEITTDMNLVTGIPDEPVEISWELSQYDVMNIYGELQSKMLPEEGVPVTLKAVLTYTGDEKKQAQYECMARICPPGQTEEEKRASRVQEAIQKEGEKTRTKEWMRLPETVDGKAVAYYPKMDNRGLIGIGMAVLTGFLLCALGREKVKEDMQKKERQMLLDYPEVVNKLTLFLGAGMTVKRAWRKIVLDYEEQKNIWGERCVYEEMKVACHEMDSGITEVESYERFGRRCGLQEYIRLGALLSQNLRKGTRGLGQLLRLEAIQAFEERKARAKRLGEEAGTKLLGPMFLMLAVVLFIVIVPAFMSMQM